ncbi:hypothetical protein [uncultured Empedobacter sp.]|uniref:hypothetical protein n=1 Tax=uncultured Empedobacter sp. TaxID=410844 RepID=UPI0025E946C4|nr:hypothetical protein [uncultured Empedobacter sp.]
MSETLQNSVDKVIDTFTNRLKIPIISTYVIVLIFHNWDLVYYLLFQTGEATTKIAYIKKNFPNYWERIFDALFFAVVILIVFTVLDLILSIALKTLYKAKKKVTDEVNEYKSIDELNSALLKQVTTNKELEKKLKDLLESQKKLSKNFIELNEQHKKEKDKYDPFIQKNKILIDFSLLISKICEIDSTNQTEVMSLFCQVMEKIDSNLILDEDRQQDSQEIIINKVVEEIEIIISIYKVLQDRDYLVINHIDNDLVYFEVYQKMEEPLTLMGYTSY